MSKEAINSVTVTKSVAAEAWKKLKEAVQKDSPSGIDLALAEGAQVNEIGIMLNNGSFIRARPGVKNGGAGGKYLSPMTFLGLAASLKKPRAFCHLVERGASLEVVTPWGEVAHDMETLATYVLINTSAEEGPGDDDLREAGEAMLQMMQVLLRKGFNPNTPIRHELPLEFCCDVDDGMENDNKHLPARDRVYGAPESLAVYVERCTWGDPKIAYDFLSMLLDAGLNLNARAWLGCDDDSDMHEGIRRRQYLGLSEKSAAFYLLESIGKGENFRALMEEDGSEEFLAKKFEELIKGWLANREASEISLALTSSGVQGEVGSSSRL